MISELRNNAQYQTKIREAFWDIHGKSIAMALRKIAFVIQEQGQKSKEKKPPHDTMPISLTANFAKIRPMVYDTDLNIQNYGYVVLHTVGVFFILEQYD